jgi:hypothetical protein
MTSEKGKGGVGFRLNVVPPRSGKALRQDFKIRLPWEKDEERGGDGKDSTNRGKGSDEASLSTIPKTGRPNKSGQARKEKTQRRHDNNLLALPVNNPGVLI